MGCNCRADQSAYLRKHFFKVGDVCLYKNNHLQILILVLRLAVANRGKWTEMVNMVYFCRVASSRRPMVMPRVFGYPYPSRNLGISNVYVLDI